MCVILSFAGAAAWADHTSCNPEEGIFGISDSNSYVGSQTTGGGGATYGTDGATVCFISPLAPERGANFSANRTPTATPGARIDFVMCSFVFQEACSPPYFSPVGAEIGTVSGTTVTGTTVYKAYLGPTALGTTGFVPTPNSTTCAIGGPSGVLYTNGGSFSLFGTGIDQGTQSVGTGGVTTDGTSVCTPFGKTSVGNTGLETQIAGGGGLLVRPVANDYRPVGYTGFVTTPNPTTCATGGPSGYLYVNGGSNLVGTGFDPGTQSAGVGGVTSSGKKVCTPAGNFGPNNGPTGVQITPGLGPITPQTDLNPEGGVGARSCGHNATIYNDGGVVHSQPLDVGVGSLSC